MPGTRMVILTIETICDLFRDYCGMVGFPEDAKPIKLMFNPQERKLGIVVESETKMDKPMEEIKFDIRRVFGVS
jgi:hypothetical protein